MFVFALRAPRPRPLFAGYPVTKALDAFRLSHFCDAFGGERDTLKPRGKAMSFPIVGIGASAGGLESISALLAGIPANTGMAYVFVQHLDPGHVSHLAKILSNRAALPVEEAREGEIFPDHLYVIIPNTTLTITQSCPSFNESRSCSKTPPSR
jgi:chemotaxis response regulator CheB